MATDETVSFKVEREENAKTKEILKEIYDALKEKGYNPIKQTRNLIRQIERDELLEKMVKEYIEVDKN